MPSAGPTVKSLDERVDDLERAVHTEITDLKVKLASFQSSMETSLNLAKWIGTLATGIIITLIGFGWQYSTASGELKQRVSGLEQRIEHLEQKVDTQGKQLEDLKQIILKRLPPPKEGA